RHVVGVEGGHVVGVVEDIAELLSEAGQLLVGDVEAGQAGHVGDVGGGDAVGHAPMLEAPTANPGRSFRIATGRSGRSVKRTGWRGQPESSSAMPVVTMADCTSSTS